MSAIERAGIGNTPMRFVGRGWGVVGWGGVGGATVKDRVVPGRLNLSGVQS